jgi:hypothetical protein
MSAAPMARVVAWHADCYANGASTVRSLESGVADLRHEEFDMNAFTRCALASAMALAFAVPASAQTSTGAMTAGTSSSNGGGKAMRGPSANANMPPECASLTGSDLGQCLKNHGGASGFGMSGDNNTLGRSRARNDKSTEGSLGSGNGMGTTSGANDTAAGGTSGASGNVGGTNAGK